MTFDDKDPPWIALIFRSCIDTGVYPDTWKKYNMVPVHKKGDKQIINNYRPVSLFTNRHVYKYEAVCSAVDIDKIEKNSFLLQNNQLFTKGVEIFRKYVF